KLRQKPACSIKQPPTRSEVGAVAADAHHARALRWIGSVTRGVQDAVQNVIAEPDRVGESVDPVTIGRDAEGGRNNLRRKCGGWHRERSGRYAGDGVEYLNRTG